MTTLTEGTHYETVLIEPRRFVYAGGECFGYCADVVNGRARVVRRTHPDVSDEDLITLGEHLRKVGEARNKRLDSANRRS